VALSWRLRQRQVEDGWVDAISYVGAWYPTYTVFNVLDTKGIIVI
jgi:hypothetical protein